MGTYYMSQNLYFRLCKLTFGELDSEILVLQNLHDLTQMFCLFFMCFAENKDVTTTLLWFRSRGSRFESSGPQKRCFLRTLYTSPHNLRVDSV
jgi:hypothetical protein